MPNIRSVSSTIGSARAEHRAHRLGLERRAATSPAARAAGPGSTITVGPPSTGTTSPGAVPAGSIAVGALAGPSPAFGSRLASASGSKRMRRANPARIAAIFSSIPSSSTSSRPANRATTSAVRSSAVGPSPPLVTIRSHALGRRGSAAPPRGPRGGRRRTRMCATSTPSSPSRSRDPGPVAVGDPAGEHLGAGDHDPGAHGHAPFSAHGQLRAGVGARRSQRRCGRRSRRSAGPSAFGSSRWLAVDRQRRPGRRRSRAGSAARTRRRSKLLVVAGRQHLAVDQRLARRRHAGRPRPASRAIELERHR